MDDGLDGERSAWVGRATWGFVAVGVVLRVFRYGMDFPLWSDEAFVAVNFLTRGYRDLLRPLDYGQICPVLFLWAERAAVGVFGFAEWSLRLVPLACGVGSLFLFRRLAGRLAGGTGAMLAVGVFAISVGPIRHASEVKPYASDLLAALILLGPALGWLREPERTGRLWGLAALVPLAQAMSHPAVFVAGGIVVGLAPAAWRGRTRGGLLPFVAVGAATALSFAASYLLVMRPQDAAMPEGLRGYWDAAFPPLGRPLGLLRWLVIVHTGKMLAYPGGGDGGASAATLALVVAGGVALWRRGDRAALAVLLGPLGLTLTASALRRYPYGGESRHMQYIAPAVCLLAGIGADACLRGLVTARWRPRSIRWAAGLLAAGAVVLPIQNLTHPYINPYDRETRAFARGFWPGLARDAEVACLSTDDPRRWNLREAFAVCNRRIAVPGLRDDAPRLDRVTADRPLRCVLGHAAGADDPAVAGRLAEFDARFERRRDETIVVDLGGPKGPPNRESYRLIEFVPRGVTVSREGPTRR